MCVDGSGNCRNTLPVLWREASTRLYVGTRLMTVKSGLDTTSTPTLKATTTSESSSTQASAVLVTTTAHRHYSSLTAVHRD
jgi:hypothetical protein